MPNLPVVHPQFGVVPREFINPAINPDALGAGIQGTFGVVTYKGRSWGIRYHGESYPLWQYDAYGRPIGTVPSIEAVFINVSPTLAKTYYLKGYVEGSTEAPDCWSPNGVVPDPGSPHVQNPTCQGCRHNVFGSRTGDGGQRGKACQDHKRIAVVPAPDLKNERYGGPMLLRVPPASLTTILDFSDRMKSMGWPFYSFATQVSFDPTVAYPKMVFHETRPLEGWEVQIVHGLQQDPRTARIINEGVEFETPEVSPTASTVPAPAATASPPPPPPPTPTVSTGPATTPPPQAQPAPQPAPAPQGGGWGAPVAAAPPVGQEAGADPGPMPQRLVRTPGEAAQGTAWGGPPQGSQAAPAINTAPAAAPAPAQAIPQGMDPVAYQQFLDWQRAQGQQAAPAEPAKRTRKPRPPAVSPQPTATAAPAEPPQQELLPPAPSPAPSSAPSPSPASPPPPASGWGAPPPTATMPPAGPVSNGQDPGGDQAIAGFDDRLSKLL